MVLEKLWYLFMDYVLLTRLELDFSIFKNINTTSKDGSGGLSQEGSPEFCQNIPKEKAWSIYKYSNTT